MGPYKYLRMFCLSSTHDYYVLEFTEWKMAFLLCAGKVGVPKQLVIKKDASSISDAVVNVGLKLPLGMYTYAIHGVLCSL